MSASEIIKAFQELPLEERRHVASYIPTEDESWIPVSFRQGMAEAEAGLAFDMETIFREV